MSKKGNSEFSFIVWFFVFLTILTIGGRIVAKTIIERSPGVLPDWMNVFGLNDILGQFIFTIGLFFIQEYVGLLILAIITIPILYIIARLIRGGG